MKGRTVTVDAYAFALSRPIRTTNNNTQGTATPCWGGQAQVALARRTVTPRTMRACYSHFKSSAPHSVLIPKDKPPPVHPSSRHSIKNQKNRERRLAP